MSIDRRSARRRVTAITAWAAAGAAVLTAGFAFGASRNSPASTKTAARPAAPRRAYTPSDDAAPQVPDGAGFTPPEASAQPPQAMSGGS